MAWGPTPNAGMDVMVRVMGIEPTRVCLEGSYLAIEVSPAHQGEDSNHHHLQ